MSDEKVLTKEIAEKFMEDDDSVDLSEFTAIEDQAAEVLSNYEEDLDLSQLLSISDVSTESLRSHRGRLALGCPRLSLHAGLHLADHRGPLEIDPLSTVLDRYQPVDLCCDHADW